MSGRITSAFGAKSTAREVVAGHDLSGRVAIVTGAATGIGVETARALALAGAEVIIAARKPELGEEVANAINEEAGSKRVSFGMLDLSSLEAIRHFVNVWGDRRIDILINNAAVMASPLMRTADGFEMQFGTNHLGHFLLSVLLAPNLIAGAKASGKPSRLVSLSSIGHRRSGIHFDDPNYTTRPYEKWEAYGQAKTANSLFAVGFDKRFKDQGVHANAVMPGGILTPLQRHLPIEEQRALGWLDENDQPREGFKTTEQGAATSVWAAVGSELEGVGGLYLEDCNQALPWSKENPWTGVMPHALDPEAADRLWDLSVDIVGAGA
ncbi:SDR family NAD(P)-dependent oxidoreductase [Caulobacter vibrioides]|uniref:Probable oxidoreductase n=2 Tax=Caulobacter vibrioides TaxID=155892 RepID=Q9AB36_CAUVC|nr:SDR family NAD(P)-dependent oxidoreductase [Caulobacter vibrioides]YP_002515778.1 short chain dehydrogenase [Caulobacter vibrioides NA1000]AAK22385.1 oxidoreductase, short-chain dehydrogenase/reductase family [Caulobacter vibrioides CB15]ACL93870.1 short chain dehydrogenase [Caulobacter vibrioides NA1000]ATC27229.1 oxidoreductase [Caulobacter vibrioides]QXZ52491.1 SDR family NAD(P)-dependent oxidoreductase [Caulobacter vibrioides]